MSGPRLGLDGERRLDAVADGACQLGQADREFLRGRDDLAVAQREGGAPALAPGLDVGVVVGPGEMLGQFSGDGVEVQRRVEVVPAEHFQGRQIVSVLRPCEKWAKLIWRSSPSP